MSSIKVSFRKWDFMDDAEKISREIAKENKELNRILEDIAAKQKEADAKALHIGGLERALKILNKPTPAAVKLRKGSDAEKTRDVLLASETPLHIDVILTKIGKTGAGAKASLVGSLNAYFNAEKVFTKPAPNTFGLIGKEYPAQGNDTRRAAE